MTHASTYINGTIYLSGGMQHAKNLGGDWRQSCSTKLKQLQYHPIDITELDKQYQHEHGDIMRSCTNGSHGELQRKADIRQHFIYTDLQLVTQHSDAIIVFYDESVRKGAGTISECQTAYDNDIPIFIVSDWQDWKKEIPFWLYGLSTKIFTRFDDLYSYLEALPAGILKRDQYGNRSSGNYYLCSLTGEPFLKSNHHYVSTVSPLYSKTAVEVVKHTMEKTKDRYQFFVEQLSKEK